MEYRTLARLFLSGTHKGAHRSHRQMPTRYTRLLLFPLDIAWIHIHHGIHDELNNTAILQAIFLQQVIVGDNFADLALAV